MENICGGKFSVKLCDCCLLELPLPSHQEFLNIFQAGVSERYSEVIIK